MPFQLHSIHHHRGRRGGGHTRTDCTALHFPPGEKAGNGFLLLNRAEKSPIIATTFMPRNARVSKALNLIFWETCKEGANWGGCKQSLSSNVLRLCTTHYFYCYFLKNWDGWSNKKEEDEDEKRRRGKPCYKLKENFGAVCLAI